MSEGFAGGCLCGKVRYECAGAPQLSAHCHCVDCRKTSGTGHATHSVVPQNALRVQGALKAYDHPADSGNIVTRNFCPDCGSPIYSTNSAMPGMAFIRASSLDDPEVAKPAMAVYASRAASWDKVDASLPSFPLMPQGGPKQAIADAQ
ncbi:MAG: GFA family protein [Pseudomonadota bacterium]|nr:GFA family protein [Pseudomonadota bacterium]